MAKHLYVVLNRGKVKLKGVYLHAVLDEEDTGTVDNWVSIAQNLCDQAGALEPESNYQIYRSNNEVDPERGALKLIRRMATQLMRGEQLSAHRVLNSPKAAYLGFSRDLYIMDFDTLSPENKEVTLSSVKLAADKLSMPYEIIHTSETGFHLIGGAYDMKLRLRPILPLMTKACIDKEGSDVISPLVGTIRNWYHVTRQKYPYPE